MIPLALALLACAPPDTAELFGTMSLVVEPDADQAAKHFVEIIDSAKATVQVALPAGDDLSLSDAIIAAFDRPGVEVEVVTDIDLRDTPAIAALRDAGVPMVLADHGIEYFDFSMNADVAWTSDKVIMSHAYAIADHQRAVTASSMGSLEHGNRVILDLTGEDLLDDIRFEHEQLMGGADATALTAFSSPAKSIVDHRWAYPMDSDALLELWLGPQERLTKRIIDAVYGARASVWILSEDVANDGLATALQDKAERGFDVRVIVGAGFGTTSPGQSQVLQGDTPDVVKGRVADVRVPTVVIIDAEQARDGSRSATTALFLSHPLYSASRLYNGQEVITDQLVDGAMWAFDDFGGPKAPEVQALIDLFTELEARSEAL